MDHTQDEVLETEMYADCFTNFLGSVPLMETNVDLIMAILS